MTEDVDERSRQARLKTDNGNGRILITYRIHLPIGVQGQNKSRVLAPSKPKTCLLLFLLPRCGLESKSSGYHNDDTSRDFSGFKSTLPLCGSSGTEPTLWGKGRILSWGDTMERAAHMENELFPVYLSTGNHVLNLEP